MCYKEGLWQEYLDGELDIEQEKLMEGHLKECSICQAVVKELKEQNTLVSGLITQYNSELNKKEYQTRSAWQTFVKNNENAGKRGLYMMFNKLPKKAAAVAAGFCLIGALTFTPVSNAFAEFLQIFRAKNISSFTVTMEDMNRIKSALSEGGEKINIEGLGKIECSEINKITIQEQNLIQEKVGFDVKTPEFLPQGFSFQKADLVEYTSMKMNFDVEKFNQFITSLGGEKLLPSSISGKTFSINVPKNMSTVFSDSENNKIFIWQGKSPELIVPDGVDVNTIKEALLGLQIMPDDLKRKLIGANWQETLFIPTAEGSSEEVNINGANGIYISNEKAREVTFEFKEDMTEEEREQAVNINGHKAVRTGQSIKPLNTLIWQEDGIVFIINAHAEKDEILQFARSMR